MSRLSRLNSQLESARKAGSFFLLPNGTQALVMGKPIPSIKEHGKATAKARDEALKARRKLVIPGLRGYGTSAYKRAKRAGKLESFLDAIGPMRTTLE